jgi:hypothetical protein
MNKISLETANESRAFEPGTAIEVDAAWELDAQPRAIELRVVWNMQGRRVQDFQIVDTVSLDASQSERKRIPLTLPREPYSFTGKYASLIWTLELVVLPSQDSARLPITIGPGGKAVHIGFQGRETTDNVFSWLVTGPPSLEELD